MLRVYRLISGLDISFLLSMDKIKKRELLLLDHIMMIIIENYHFLCSFFCMKVKDARS